MNCSSYPFVYYNVLLGFPTEAAMIRHPEGSACSFARPSNFHAGCCDKLTPYLKQQLVMRLPLQLMVLVMMMMTMMMMVMIIINNDADADHDVDDKEEEMRIRITMMMVMIMMMMVMVGVAVAVPPLCRACSQQKKLWCTELNTQQLTNP